MKRYLSIAVLLVSAAALLFGIVRLFELRFEAGDVYPEYSSLRADPLGAMALYDSLDRLPELTVKRDFSTTDGFPDGTNATCLLLGVSPEAWRQMPEETFKEMEQFVSGGGRLAITLFPEPSLGNNSTPPIPAPANNERPRATPYRDLWGVDLNIVNLERSGNTAYEPAIVQNSSALPLPEALEWHSGIVFTRLNPDWQPLYTRGENPVMIVRTFGLGTAVIATDSWFLSNEAMQKDRHADLLSWLIGPGKTVVFDEAHLGVTESPGVATLIRRYRLQWFVAAIAALALLFVWKMSMPLVRPRAGETVRDYIAGKDAASGFVNLLRRSISTRDVLATCFSVWKKSAAQSGRYSDVRIRQAEAAFDRENSLPAKDRDHVRAYQAISKTLQIQNK